MSLSALPPELKFWRHTQQRLDFQGVCGTREITLIASSHARWKVTLETIHFLLQRRKPNNKKGLLNEIVIQEEVDNLVQNSRRLAPHHAHIEM
jgi:hypothetical protein